jgi:WD40 repeat protein
VQLWNVTTGRRLARLDGHADRLTGVAFSPDGRTLAATATDADIRLWTLADLFGDEIRRGPRATD